MQKIIQNIPKIKAIDSNIIKSINKNIKNKQRTQINKPSIYKSQKYMHPKAIIQW